MTRRAFGSAAILLTAAALAAAASGGAGTPPHKTIGLVFQGTAVGDPYQHGVIVGLRRAVRELGVTAKTIAAQPGQSSLPAFTYLVRHGYDLVLTFGINEVGDLDRAALKFPGRPFAIVDASVRDLRH